MKILFVFPTKLNSEGTPVKYRKAFLPPLAMAVLDSLTPDHHDVHIIDDIVDDVDCSVHYDLVAITAMTMQVERAYQIADAFRERGVPVVMGGMHPTILPKEVKQHADAVVIGEADNLWPKVLDDCENGRLKDFYQEEEFPDLSKLVIPKWDNMNLKNYPKRIGAKLPMMPIFTTRGCPFGCSFCSVSAFFGKSTRVKPIDHVLQELDATQATEYLFTDDNVCCNPDYSRELFSALEGRDLNWVSQVSSTVMKNPDLLERAARSGCTGMLVGVESLSKTTLKSVRKGFNKVDEYKEMIQCMKKNGIHPCFSFIFGFDEDTEEQFRYTVEFCKEHRVGYSIFWILTPLPGTKLYADMEEEGRIEYTDWSMFDLNHVVFQPTNFSRQGLRDSFWDNYKELYTVKNMARTIWDDVSNSKKPVRDFWVSLFVQTYFRKKIYSYDHPLTGGIGMI